MDPAFPASVYMRSMRFLCRICLVAGRSCRSAGLFDVSPGLWIKDFLEDTSAGICRIRNNIGANRIIFLEFDYFDGMRGNVSTKQYKINCEDICLENSRGIFWTVNCNSD